MNTRILEQIIASGMTKREIIDRSGLTRPTLDYLLDGNDPKVSTLERVAAAVGMPVTIFFDGETPTGGEVRYAEGDYHEVKGRNITYNPTTPRGMAGLHSRVADLEARIADKEQIIALLKSENELLKSMQK